MKVYLAARYTSKLLLKTYAEQLRKEGIEVTSSWLEEPHAPNTTMDELPEKDLTQYASDDLKDIDAADALVFFSIEPTQKSVRGGRHVEFGYALGTKKPILVVGPRENIFHHLPTVFQLNTWPEAVKVLHFVRQFSSSYSIYQSNLLREVAALAPNSESGTSSTVNLPD